LIGTQVADHDELLSLQDSLNELTLLADTAGLSVVGQITQRLKRPNSKTFIGKGKVQEAKLLAGETLAEVILFDHELSPRHQRELEREFGDELRVVDRTALILDVFAQHARTREGGLQVELAQYEYRLPRLTRAWTHLARQAGGGAGRTGSAGGVGLRGPGETQLEVDRRDIGRRIDTLKDEIEKVRAHRGRHRQRRRRGKIPTAALVGYTNAGKSTLLNTLSGSDVLVADQLFATLDPTTRRVKLPAGSELLVTDTVGFIQKLPTTLVAAFRATLEEIVDADLLLHIVDANHVNARAHISAVHSTLEEIGGAEIPMILVLNKMDAVHYQTELQQLLDEAISISALTGEGTDQLLLVIEDALLKSMVKMDVTVPYSDGQLIHLIHEHGVVDHVVHEDSVVRIVGRVPRHLVSKIEERSQDTTTHSDTS
jgi:GTP-binding protein HflX